MPDIVLSLVIITSLCFCSKYFEQKHRAQPARRLQPKMNILFEYLLNNM